MLVVTVELRSAIDGHREVLGEVVIANDGTGTHRKGNYKAVAVRKGRKQPLGLSVSVGSKDVTRQTEVKGYNRISEPVWNLVAKCLKGMGYD